MSRIAGIFSEEATQSLPVLATEDADLISIREVLRAVMAEMGGAKGFARNLKMDFDAMKPGQIGRVQLETNLIRALQNYGFEEGGDDADLEELEAEARRLMEKADATDGE